MIRVRHDPPLEIGDGDGHEHGAAEGVDERLDRDAERREARRDEGGEDDDGDRAHTSHVAPFRLPGRDPAFSLRQKTTAPATAAIPTTAHGGRTRRRPNSTERERDVPDVVHGGGEHGVPERGCQQADDGGADAGDGGLHGDPLAGGGPQRQRGTEEQERRQEDRDERDRGACDAVRRRMLDRAEVGGEREQRPRHRLRCAVAGEERLLRDPARRDDGLVQERQHDVAAAEDERPGAVEALHQVEGVPGAEPSDERQARRGGPRSTGLPRSP